MNLVATPWDNTVRKSAKQRVIAVGILFLAVMGLSAFFANSAAKAESVNGLIISAQGASTSNGRCENVIIAGDRHADGVRENLESFNVDEDNVSFLTEPGSDIDDLIATLESQTFTSTDCIIIDSGLADAYALNNGDATEEEIRQRIEDALAATEDAGTVIWTTPVVADEFPEDSLLDREDWDPADFNEILKDVIENDDNDNTHVADISDLGSTGSFEDGVKMDEEGYAQRLISIFESIESGVVDGEELLKDLLEAFGDLIRELLEFLGIDPDEFLDEILNELEEELEDEENESGSGNGSGDGSEDGDGSGNGSGDGSGNGSGNGSGDGSGNGSGSGDGSGNGSGNNSGGGGGSSPSPGDEFTTGDTARFYERASSAPYIGGRTNDSGSADPNVDEIDKLTASAEQAMSPRTMANKVLTSEGFSYANNYLAMSRWTAFHVPSPGINPLSGGDLLSGGSALIAQMAFNIIAAMNSALIGFFSFAFSNVFGSVALKLGDMLFGTVLGGMFSGGGDVVKASLLLSALVTVTLVTSLFSAFDAHNARKSLQARVMSVIMSIAKVIVFFIVVGGIGMQSAKNHGMWGGDTAEEITEDLGRQIEKDGGIRPDDYQIDLNDDGTLDPNIDPRYTPDERSMVLTDSTSWEPLSMGWIVSVILDIANMAVNAVLELLNSLIVYPIGSMATGMDNVVNKHSSSAPLNACSRYVDAMHYAYSNSAAAKESASFAKMMTSIDIIYTRTILNAYSKAYGDTLSGNSAWCHLLESGNNASSGDRAMLGRTAGLWWEVVGDGNLLDGNSRTYTAGYHRIGGTDANIETSAFSGRHGVLVDGSGNWISEWDGTAAIRGNVFFGMNSMPTLEGDNPTKAADSAIWYFSACEWNPNDGGTYLNREWGNRKVKAMPSADTDYEDQNSYLTEEQYQGIYEGGADGKFGAPANRANASNRAVRGLLDHSQTQFGRLINNSAESGDANDSQYLHNVDCYNIANFPVGHDKEGNNFGWGANNRMSDRWYYSPGNTNLIAQTVARATSTAPGWANTLVNLAANIVGGEDEMTEARRNSMAENAFVAAEDPELNRNHAYEFWLGVNGRGSALDGLIWVVILSWISYALVIVFMLPVALIGLVVNFVFALLLIAIPAMVMVNLLLRTFKGGK